MSTQLDEWNVAAVDLDAYLDRIDHPPVTPSTEALRSLHEAHVRAIPFENVDVVLEQHRGIDLEVITDKLVRRERGGYCFEHALLFAAVLERLGFTVERRMARVMPQRPGTLTHMMSVVAADGVDHLVDVGFGAGMMVPTPLEDGIVVDQAGWKHLLTREGPLWVVAKSTEDGWDPLHGFSDLPAHHIDYVVAHHYVSTHPRSPFTGQLVVMRLDHGLSRRLVGNELTVEHADGHLERTLISPDDVGSTLRDLDVVLTAEEIDRLRALGDDDRTPLG
jgi:N-hydroxyarylamine O-acetyltransferase